MLSTSRKFLFVHIYKTAGNSVRDALGAHADRPNAAQRLANRVSKRTLGRNVFRLRPVAKHADALTWRDHTGDLYDDLFKFAFVRNPYDWIVSLYAYIRQDPRHYLHDRVRAMTFADFVAWHCDSDHKLQRDFLVDETDACIVDFIGRFETLDADFREICRRIGIEADLPHVNASKRATHLDYYDETTRARVAETFARDFETFGYSREIDAAGAASGHRGPNRPRTGRGRAVPGGGRPGGPG